VGQRIESFAKEGKVDVSSDGPNLREDKDPKRGKIPGTFS